MRIARGKIDAGHQAWKLGIAIALAMTIAGCNRPGMTDTGSSSPSAPVQPPDGPVASSDVQQNLTAYRGKVVILDFWATWCGPCRLEIPGFISLQNKYKSQGLEIVGVSLDPMTNRGNPQAVPAFMKQVGINYTVLLASNGAALHGYDVGEGIPTTYIIDKQGNVRNRYVGAQPESVFEDEIKQLL